MQTHDFFKYVNNIIDKLIITEIKHSAISFNATSFNKYQKLSYKIYNVEINMKLASPFFKDELYVYDFEIYQHNEFEILFEIGDNDSSYQFIYNIKTQQITQCD